MRVVGALAIACALGGCVTTETVSYLPKPHQQAMVRDGVQAIVSRRATSLIVLRPASREIPTHGRPVFAVGIYNLSNQPLEFRVAGIRATQIVNQQTADLRVITYEDLVREERTRQVFQAIATGLVVGANAYSASQAGHYRANSTVHTPRGTYNVHTVGYSPTANAIAQSRASAQNEAMISATVEQGQANLGTLERSVIKDNTLMPGEWYGGQLHLQPLMSDSSGKSYTIAFSVGSERHEIDIKQSTQ
jgi:hypothetical protein